MQLKKAKVLETVREARLIPVLRAPSAEIAIALAQAVIAAGIRVLEVTLTVPDAMAVLGRLRKEYPELLLGAGTVLDPETARVCLQEGAQFIVSPALNLSTVELCREQATVVFPGALTPTEIVTAWQAGADAIKVFPANAMGGASYLRSLRGPLPQIPIIPTGGVSVETAGDFLEAGALALGVGTDLMNAELIRTGQAHLVQAKAEAYLRAVSRTGRSNATAPAAPPRV